MNTRFSAVIRLAWLSAMLGLLDTSWAATQIYTPFNTALKPNTVAVTSEGRETEPPPDTLTESLAQKRTEIASVAALYSVCIDPESDTFSFYVSDPPPNEQARESDYTIVYERGKIEGSDFHGGTIHIPASATGPLRVNTVTINDADVTVFRTVSASGNGGNVNSGSGGGGANSTGTPGPGGSSSNADSKRRIIVQSRKGDSFVPFNKKLVRSLLRSPLALKPRDFELGLGHLVCGMGHFENIIVTKQTRDGGWDLEFSLPDIFETETPFRCLVEAKRFSIRRAVPIDVVQRFCTVFRSQGADRGYIVTTSHFSPDALAFCKSDEPKIKLLTFEEFSAVARNWSNGTV